MAIRFHLRKEGIDWGWRLVDDTAPNGPRVLAMGAQAWPTKGEADAAISAMRRAVADADTVVDTTVPEPRWRTISPDGVIGEPVGDDPPDNDDEGETGPPEVQG